LHINKYLSIMDLDSNKNMSIKYWKGKTNRYGRG